MVDGLADLAEAAIDVADAVGEIVDAGSKRKRRKGCLILTLLVLAGILVWYFVLS